jgi:hypothetical protein
MNWKLVILFFWIASCSGQPTTSYTLECSSNFTIDVPPNSRDTIFNYEEGFFKTYYWINGDILDIHCGSLNDNVYLSDSLRYEVLNIREDNQKKIIRGKEKTGEKTFGVLKIKGYRVTISFLSSPDREKLFLKILNDIKRN